jgi:hypothetical protein
MNMPATSTSATPPARRADQLIERARIGREQPSDASEVREINGATLVTLTNVNGVLATYRVDDDKLKRITDLSRYEMPFEDRREFVAVMVFLFGKAGQPSVEAHTVATQQKLVAAAVAGGFKDAALLDRYIERGALTSTALDLAFDAIECAGGVDTCWDTIEVDTMLASAFHELRAPRSDEYRAGARAALQFRVDGTPISRPYPVGSAGDDAFDGGMVEGHSIWRRAIAAGAEFHATGCLPRQDHAASAA